MYIFSWILFFCTIICLLPVRSIIKGRMNSLVIVRIHSFISLHGNLWRHQTLLNYSWNSKNCRVWRVCVCLCTCIDLSSTWFVTQETFHRIVINRNILFFCALILAANFDVNLWKYCILAFWLTFYGWFKHFYVWRHNRLRPPYFK